MKEFWIRFSIFFLLWVGFSFPYIGSEEFVYIVIACTCTMVAYFFLPLTKHPFILYFLINLIISLIPIFVHTNENIFFVLLILYILLEALYHLTTKMLRIFMILTGSFILTNMLFVFNWPLESYIFFAMFFFLVDRLNISYLEKQELRNVYEQLIVEYRKLKRTVYESDQAARLEERTKIARDIHDSVGHKLTALLMQLEMISMKNQKEDLQIIKQLAKESLEETRDAVKALKFGEHEGIATVLHLIRKLESESHIHIHFTTKQGVLSTKLSNRQSIVLYRTIQEALTNAMRHAQSKEVKIVLGKSAIGEFEFNISNQIYERKAIKKGFGLSNMEERLKEIGGKLHIYQLDNTFIVNGTFPLKGEVGHVENINS